MQPEELFETYTPEGEPLGRLPRSRVHAEGFWHKSTHVFLFDGAGRLWVQKRVPHKDICGDLWDYSVGEHLKPGETFLEAAHRGLEEELGLRDVALVRFGGLQHARNEMPDLGVHDYELQQAFKGVHDGPLAPDPAEVAGVQAVPLTALGAWVAARPEDFTPWFRRDLVAYRIL